MSANMIADEVRRLCIIMANANVALRRRSLTPSARMNVTVRPPDRCPPTPLAEVARNAS
jgi:hypothetical protein